MHHISQQRRTVLLLTLAGCSCSTAPVAPTSTAVATASAPPAAARSRQLPISGFFGVNEGVSIPSTLLRNRRLTLDQQQQELLADVAQLNALGAQVVRANCHTYPFLNHHAVRSNPTVAQQRADAYVSTVQRAGLKAVMVLGPWPCIQTANYTTQYLPEDTGAYATFIEQFVERYDGDGVDDMPGLQPGTVVGWEVDNEPDLHNSVPPRGAKRDIDPSTFETPEEYAEIVRITTAAIRRTDPSTPILLAGMYNPRSPSGHKYLQTVLSEPGVLDAIDVLSLHCYNDDDSLEAIEQTIDVANALAPSLPVWITEIGVTSQGRRPWQNETWQAKMVVALHGAALAGGVERLFWHTLSDPPSQPNQRSMPFGHHSLTRTEQSSWDDPNGVGQRQTKPAGAVYTRLTQHLMSTPDAEMKPMEQGDGKGLQVGEAMLVYWGEWTLPDGSWVVEDLLTGATETVTAPHIASAPAWVAAAQ